MGASMIKGKSTEQIRACSTSRTTSPRRRRRRSARRTAGARRPRRLGPKFPLPPRGLRGLQRKTLWHGPIIALSYCPAEPSPKIKTKILRRKKKKKIFGRKKKKKKKKK